MFINNMQKKGKTVLLIEDEPAIREIYTEALTNEGYLVVSAVDGEEGLHKLSDQYFDLTLLGILIPKLSGIEVLEKFRATKKKQGKIVIITNLEDATIISKSFSLGVDGYEVMTSISPNDLVQRVNGYLSGSITPEESKKGILEKIEEKTSKVKT